MTNLQMSEDMSFSRVLKDQFTSFMSSFEEILNENFKDIPGVSKYRVFHGDIDRPWTVCLSEGKSYTAPLMIGIETNEATKELHLCDIPLLTPRGTFIIKGQERISKKVLKATDISKDKQEKKHLSEAEKTRDLRFYNLVVIDFYKILQGWLTNSIKKEPDYYKIIISRLLKSEKNKASVNDPIEGFGGFSSRLTDSYTSIFKSQFGAEYFPFIDSTNPLAEVEHMRKLTFIRGARTKYGRDIHPTHYGRLCVVETPESEKIGMRLHLAHKARIEDGKILTPLCKTSGGPIEYVAPEQDGFLADRLTELKESVLARGVDESTDDARYIASSEVEYTDAFDDQLFGYAALQVPFIQHNDPARSLMGAKNLKQAVPLREPEIPIIKTGYEEAAAELSGRTMRAEKSGKVVSVSAADIIVSSEDKETKYSYIKGVPSVSSKTAFFQSAVVKENDDVEKGQILAEGAGIKNGSLALGVNALAAYMPYFGYNMDDGLVVSEGLAEKLTSVHMDEFDIRIKAGDIPEWIIKEGDKIERFPKGKRFKDIEDNGKMTVSPIAVLKRIKDRKTEKITMFAKEEMLGGIVRKAFVEPERIRLWVQRDRKLEVGDKLMGRHGNKGIVAKIFPTGEMPYFDIEINNKTERRHIDIVLNPHSVMTRMNIGQIYETHLGWVAKEHPDEDVRNGAGIMGKPFSKVDLGTLAQWLEKSGLDNRGKVRLKLPEGNKTANPVVVGYQYIVKLNHLASSKLSTRGETGPVSFVTDLPLSGKKREGGQRLGEMEVWALLAHGAYEILGDMLGYKSNAYKLQGTEAISISESMKALIYYLRGLGISLEILDDKEYRFEPEDFDTARRKDIKSYRIKWASDADIMAWGRHWEKSLKERLERKSGEYTAGARNVTTLADLKPCNKEQMGYIKLAEAVQLCKRSIVYLPVIPPRCRPRSDSKLNRLYEKIFLINKELQELRVDSESHAKKKAELIGRLQGNTGRLEKELAGLIKGKKGIIRKAILGKRVTLSARGVIVPDPTLPADSAMLPEKIMSGLGIKNPDIIKTGSGYDIKKAQRVLLNRQPTLHIHNIQAFNALPNDDNAIAINPLVCEGFNADFDGDTMAVYRVDKPIPDGMNVPGNIFLAKNGKLNLNFSQDIIAGIYCASRTAEGKGAFERLINDKEIFDACEVKGVITKGVVEKSALKHFLKHNDRIKTLRLAERIANFGLEQASLSGLTFGIFDLDELAISSDEKKALAYNADAIEDIMREKMAGESNLTNPIAVMIRSGAKGDIEQLLQMAGVKGFVGRIGEKTTSVGVNSSYLEGLKPTEYYLACFGARNSLGDKKLMTPQCGYLTRRLVFSALDKKIEKDDCGTQKGMSLDVNLSLGRTLQKDFAVNGKLIPKNSIIDDTLLDELKDAKITAIDVRSPLLCESDKGLCSKCYGWHLSKRTAPQAGFAAGIMSAQVIGERATQDAMRTYHKGKATSTIERFYETKAIFDNSKDPKTGKKISEEIKDTQDLFNIARTLFENYEKKVDIKHYEVMLRALMSGNEFKGTKEVIREKGLLYNAAFERAVEVFMECAESGDSRTPGNVLEKMFV